MHQGDSLRRLMLFNEAYVKYLQAEELLEPIHLWENLLVARGHRIRVLLQQEKFEIGDSLCMESLKLAQLYFGEHHKSLASFYNLMAAVEGLYRADYRKALELHKFAVKSVQSLEDSESLMVKARSLGAVGMTYEYLGDYSQAIKYIEQEMELIRHIKGEGSMYLAFSYQDLGKINALKGFYQQAENYYQKNLELLNENLPPGHDFISKSYLDLARMYNNTGRFSEALDNILYATTSYEINHDKQHSGIANALQLKGDVHFNRGEYSQAEEVYNRCRDIQNKLILEDHLEIANLQMSFGQLYVEQKKYVKAKEFALNAMRIYKEKLGANHFQFAKVLTQLAKLELYQNNFDTALVYLFRAKDIQQLIFSGKGPNAARIDFLLARVHLSLNQLDEALNYVQSGLKCMDSADPNQQMSSHPITIELNHMRAKIYHEQHLVNQLPIDLYSSFLYYDTCLLYADQLIMGHNNESKKFWLEKVFPIYEEAINVAYQSYIISKNNTYYEKALGFSEKCKSVLLKYHVNQENALAFSGVDPGILEKEQNFRHQIVALENNLLKLQNEGTRTENPTSKMHLWQSQLFDLKHRYEDLLSHLESAYPNYFDLKFKRKEFHLRQLKNDIVAADELIVEYFFGDQFLYIFSIQKNFHDWHRISIDSTLLHHMDAYANYLLTRNSITSSRDNSLRQFRSSAYKLYLKILAPALSGTSTKINKLLIIPDGRLCFLPFETLIPETPVDLTTTAPHYLLHNYTIYYKYTLASVLQKKQKTKLPYLGIAPKYDGRTPDTNSTRLGWSDLTNNVEEVNAGRARFSGIVLSDENATTSRFKELAPQANMLHLAAHAELSHDQPLQSRLIFSRDSMGSNSLYLQELFNLQLNADLVILSACNSGIGEHQRGEGLISLARGFKYAGINDIAMSLWSVNDATIMQIIKLFLDKINQGIAKPEALRQAKLAYLLSSDRLRSHPYYWASIVYVGSDTPLTINRTKNMRVYYLFGGGLMLLLVVFFLSRKKRLTAS